MYLLQRKKKKHLTFLFFILSTVNDVTFSSFTALWKQSNPDFLNNLSCLLGCSEGMVWNALSQPEVETAEHLHLMIQSSKGISCPLSIRHL